MERYWNSIASVLGITLTDNDKRNLRILELLEHYNIPYKISSLEKRILIEFIDCLGGEFERFLNEVDELLNENYLIELDNHNDVSGGIHITSEKISDLFYFFGVVNCYFEIQITSKGSGKIFITSNIFGEPLENVMVDIENFTPDTYGIFIRLIQKDNDLYRCYRRGYLKHFNPGLHNEITKYFLNQK